MLPINSKYSKTTKTLTAFSGLNRLPVTSDGELEDMVNMTMDGYPTLQTRAKRQTISDVSGKPQGITGYWYDSEHAGIAWVANGKLYLDGVEVDGFALGATSPVSMIDFWGCIYVFPDKKYYDYVNEEGGAIGSGTYPDDATACPDMDSICVHNNRIWGVKGSYVYASALGRAKGVDSSGNGAWNYFIDADGNPAEAGSYYVAVASAGDFTGVISWDNRLVALKDNFHHEVYGDYPSNFGVRSVSRWGTESQNTLAEADSRLYWSSPAKGVVMYAGGMVNNISRKLLIGNAISGGSDGVKYYVCAADGDGYRLFVYDYNLGVWASEDALHVVEFVNHRGRMYALVVDKQDTDAALWEGRVLCINPADGEEDEEDIPWSFVIPYNITVDSSDYVDFGKINATGLHVRAAGDSGSLMSVYVSHDNGDWSSAGSYSFQGGKVRDIVLNNKRCNTVRMRFEGVGSVTIYGIQYEMVYGGENK